MFFSLLWWALPTSPHIGKCGKEAKGGTTEQWDIPERDLQGSLKPNSSKLGLLAWEGPATTILVTNILTAELGAGDPLPTPGIQPLDARSDRVFRAERSQRTGSKRKRAGVTRKPLGRLESQPSLLATSCQLESQARAQQGLAPSWQQSAGWQMLAQRSRAENRECFPARSSLPHPHFCVVNVHKKTS